MLQTLLAFVIELLQALIADELASRVRKSLALLMASRRVRRGWRHRMGRRSRSRLLHRMRTPPEAKA